jgi:hypothetical protein
VGLLTTSLLAVCRLAAGGGLYIFVASGSRSVGTTNLTLSNVQVSGNTARGEWRCRLPAPEPLRMH